MGNVKGGRGVKTYQARDGESVVRLDFGTLNPKQAEFWKSTARYTCYGGAKGGGKSHVVDRLAAYGCLRHPGMKVLLLRRQYKDLLKNHIEPLQKLLPVSVAKYNASTQTMYFQNGSTITFGHFNYDSSYDSYNGQEFDWIFIDEATQFTYQQFRMLGGCLRGVNGIPKRMYLTCNPGGVGHRWVKRLFIDRDFITDPENPELTENPEDYKFVFANIEDNVAMKKDDPEGYAAYLSTLSQMPEKVRNAYRHGIWDDLGGAYFDEFRPIKHVIKPFPIPEGWRRYRAFDYGLDMFACYWVAVDHGGRCYVYREFCKAGLIVPEAAREIHNHTLPGEHIDVTFAPPDIWNTQKTDGKTMAEGFMLEDVALVRANNNRVQGHMQVKQMLADMPDGKPGLLIFNNCKHLIDDLQAIQADDNNPNDCAKEPHDVTHTCDAIRYFCISRTLPTFRSEEGEEAEDFERLEEYDEFMTGGEPEAGYILA